ncbi:hypothetical protein RJ639_001691 [Escallonia herrerae]|uniref:Core Histone H2A/H2B/H3 domain-containing protein n=1 Tax=Escallonia herrerae TaxID=1293975 RepID=A0AA88XC38_9ASTE|nr:hypothetical protein RJ639_001691 [Escallonia herrerae]
MTPKKKVVGAVVKTTKVVEETVQVSVVQSKQKGAKGGEEIIEDISPSGKEPVKILVEEKSGEERGREKEKEEERGREEEKEGDERVKDKPIKVQEAIPTPTPQKEEEKRKKATKESETKTQEGKEGGRRKRKRGKIGGGGTEGYLGGEGYKIYVFRVMKQVHPDMGISSKAMTVINNFMGDMFERLADEAARLSKVSGRMTMSSREIQGAVKLVLPGELGKHAVSEGTKAVTKYMSSVSGGSK